MVSQSVGILFKLSAFHQRKLMLADGTHISVSPILRKHRMALMGNELFFIQDVSLINKIISLVRVPWRSSTSVSVYLVWKYQLQISSESLCLAWLSSLTEPAFCNKSENNVDDLFWQQTIHLPPCLPLSGLFWLLRETRRQNLSAQ